MFENLHTSEKYKLTNAEKVRMRNELVAFMAEHPVKEGFLARTNAFFSFSQTGSHQSSFAFYAYRSVAAVLVVAVVGGGGTAYAAEAALPGDFLYTIKKNVNEKALELSAVSVKAKAQVSAKLAERRLSEAEQLAVEGRLDQGTRDALGFEFEAHAENFIKHADVLSKDEARIEVVAEVSSDLEAALSAHEGILETVLASNTRADAAADVAASESATNMARNEPDAAFQTMSLMAVAPPQDSAVAPEGREMKMPPKDALLNSVKVRLAAVAKIRAEAEAKLVVQATDTVKPAAEKKLAKVRTFALNVKKEVPVLESGTAVNADINVQAAEAELNQGEAKLQGGSYAEAFASIQKAARKVQETKFSIDAGTRLKIGIPVRVEVSPTVEATTTEPVVDTTSTTTATTTIEIEASELIDPTR